MAYVNIIQSLGLYSQSMPVGCRLKSDRQNGLSENKGGTLEFGQNKLVPWGRSAASI